MNARMWCGRFTKYVPGPWMAAESLMYRISSPGEKASPFGLLKESAITVVSPSLDRSGRRSRRRAADP